MKRVSAVALFALVSAKGSPGVTTTALALTLTWPRPVVLAECDPAGGDVLAGFFGGSVPATRSVLGVANALDRQGTADMAATLVALDGSDQRWVLPGIADAGQAAALSPRWSILADAFGQLTLHGNVVDVIADCGRLGSAYAPVPLLRAADTVVLLLRSSLRSVQAVSGWVGKLRDDLAAHGRGADRLATVLVGEGRPYAQTDIARYLDLPSPVAVPWDPRAAAVLSDGTGSGRGLGRSVLLRGARSVGARLYDQAHQPAASSDASAQSQPERHADDSKAVADHG